MPIVEGGTMLYVDALCDGFRPQASRRIRAAQA
jgi:tRNA A37 N6-isopentenylltransferase MiaA